MNEQRRWEHRGPARDPARGAIAIIVAALWMTLFGLAAFAVDIGFQYTAKRELQAAADASVHAGMPSLASSQTLARSQATAMATANGYTAGVTVTTPAANQLRVQIDGAQPLFFMKIFGFTTRTLSAVAVGQLVGGGGPAIHANGGCGSAGVTITGNSSFTINGNVESNGPINYMTGPSIDTTNGTVKSPCPGSPAMRPNDTVTGGASTGGPFADPFAGTTLASFPACTYGNLTSAYDPPYGNWMGVPGDPMTLKPGVYCSGGAMNVSTPDYVSMFIDAPNVTFIAKGVINIGANNGANLSPAAGSPHNIIAFTTDATGCGSGQAMNVGQNNFVIDGSLYAPNGCLRSGGNNMTINGSMIANELFLGMYAPWTFNAPGGSGGGAWTMLQ